MSNCINFWLDWLMERGVLRAQIGYIDWLATGIQRDTSDELWRQLFDGQERLQHRLEELDRGFVGCEDCGDHPALMCLWCGWGHDGIMDTPEVIEDE